MQAVIAPASAEVGGNRGLFILRAMLAPEGTVERMQQKINDQRVGSRVRALQSLSQPRLHHNLFVAHGLSDGVLVGGFAMLFFVEAAIVGPVQAVAPMADKAMREYAAVVTAMAIVVGAGKGRENRLQRLRSGRRHRLGEPGEIRDAEHTHSAIATGLHS